MAWVKREDGMEEWQEGPEQPAAPTGWQKFKDFTGLSMLQKASDYVQENYNFGRLAETTGLPAMRDVAEGLRAGGRLISLPAAVAGVGLAHLQGAELSADETMKALVDGVLAGGEQAAGMFTPLDVAGGLPGKVGMAANAVDAALGLGDIASGVDEGSVLRAVMGGVRVAGNTAGLVAGTRTPRAEGLPARPADLRTGPAVEEPPLAAQALREDALVEPGTMAAGRQGTREAYIRKLRSAGLNVTEDTFRGKTVKYIAEWAKTKGVDLSDTIITRPAGSEVAELTPEEIEKLLPRRPADPAIKPVDRVRMVDELRAGVPIERMLKIRALAEEAGDAELLAMADREIQGTWRKKPGRVAKKKQEPPRKPYEEEPSPTEDEVVVGGLEDEIPWGEIKRLSDKDLRIELEEARAVLVPDDPKAQRFIKALEDEAASRGFDQLSALEGETAGTQNLGPRGEITGADIDKLVEALKSGDERVAARGRGERVAAMADPVQYALSNVTNMMVDWFNSVAHGTVLGKVLGKDTPLLETMVPRLTEPTARVEQARGWRRARWTGASEDRLAVSRPANAWAAIHEVADAGGFDRYRLMQAVLDGHPAAVGVVLKQYKASLLETTAHELLHSFRGSRDTLPGGESIPSRQQIMDLSAKQMLDTPQAGGKTLRQMAEAWMEPDSPQLQALWVKELQDSARAFVRAKQASGQASAAGMNIRIADDIEQAAALRDVTGKSSDVPDDLRGKLREAFASQRLGRADANKRVKVLRARQAEILRQLEEEVQAGRMTRAEALKRYRIQADEMAAEIMKVAHPEFTGPEVETAMGIAQGKLRSKFDRYHAGAAVEKLVQGKQLTEGELDLMREVFGKKVVPNLEPGWFQKALETWGKITGSLRALMTSMDVSAVFRQSLVPTVAHPGTAARALKGVFQNIWKDANYAMAEKAILENPFRDLQDAAGLHLAQPGGGLKYVRALELSGAEEMFAGAGPVHKLPHVKYSERAYILYLNKMRSDLFNMQAKELLKEGFSIETNPALFEDIAHGINNLTGRGTLELAYVSPESRIGKALGISEHFTPGRKSGETMIPALNTAFFAPRFMASRFAILRDLPLLYSNYSAPARKMMLRDVLTTIGVGMATLGATAQLVGGKVEDDPRSSDYGKLRVGKTRYDVWGGYQPWVRFMAQMLTEQRKNVNARRPTTMRPEEKRAQFYRFFEQKLSPGASIAAEQVLGKPFNEPTEYLVREFPYVGRDVWARLTPIIAQDMYDLWEQDEQEQMFLAMPLSLLGIGVQTYDQRRGPTRRVNQ